jgi:hypothetical protein
MISHHFLDEFRACNICIVPDNAKRPIESATELSLWRQRETSVTPVLCNFRRKRVSSRKSKRSSQSKRNIQIVSSSSDARWESVPVSPEKDTKKSTPAHRDSLDALRRACKPLPLPVRRKSVEIMDQATLQEAVRKSSLPLSLPVRRVSTEVSSASVLAALLSEFDFDEDDDDDQEEEDDDSAAIEEAVRKSSLPRSFPARRVSIESSLPLSFPTRRVSIESSLPLSFPARRVSIEISSASVLVTLLSEFDYDDDEDDDIPSLDPF